MKVADLLEAMNRVGISREDFVIRGAAIGLWGQVDLSSVDSQANIARIVEEIERLDPFYGVKDHLLAPYDDYSVEPRPVGGCCHCGRRLLPLGPKEFPARCPVHGQVYSYAHRAGQKIDEASD